MDSPAGHDGEMCRATADLHAAWRSWRGELPQPPVQVTASAELTLTLLEQYCRTLVGQSHVDRIAATTGLRKWWSQWRVELHAMIATADGAALAAANADRWSLQKIAPIARRPRGTVHRDIQRYLGDHP